MCIGRPMQIIAIKGQEATAIYGQNNVKIDISLVPEVEIGEFVLEFHGAARRILSSLEAKQINDALAALEAVNNGENITGFFADLNQQSPQLPPHLKEAIKRGEKVA